MNQPIVFDDVLDAAEQLDADSQAELVAILSRRLADRGANAWWRRSRTARREFAAGQCHVMTAAEIVREGLS